MNCSRPPTAPVAASARQDAQTSRLLGTNHIASSGLMAPATLRRRPAPPRAPCPALMLSLIHI
eukprot:6392727-Prymnesium_polylepis.1